MAKVRKTRAEIEEIVLAQLKRAHRCQGVLAVTVEIIENSAAGAANWKLSHIRGSTSQFALEQALQSIVPKLETEFTAY